MKTKLFSFTLIFTLLVSLAFAQGNRNSRPSIGILGGVNMQNLNGKDFNDKKLENDMIVGYHVGVNVQLPVAPQFYFQPGLMYSTKGGENKNALSTIKFNLSYIELPLNFVYKAELGSGFFMLGFGPYVAYGIGGKHTSEVGSVKVESDIIFKSDVSTAELLTGNYIKPFDAGGNILFGYEMAGGLFVQFDAQLGMLNINPEDKGSPDSKLSIKNTGYGISLGYRF